MSETIDLKYIIDTALEAGRVIMSVYVRDFDVEFKEDESPLTEADKKANEVICSALKEKYPDIPILSEENKSIDYSVRKDWERFWLVDPVDGTKEFIKKNGEFTVNIALVEDGVPILGVVYAPAKDLMYSAEKGKGAYLNGQKLPLFTNQNPEEKLTVVASRSHLSSETEEFINDLKKKTAHVESISVGSSLKLCFVAEGRADYYPRLAPTMEWDTGAAHAIALEAGRKVVRYEDSLQLVYNKENLLNPWFVVS